MTDRNLAQIARDAVAVAARATKAINEHGFDSPQAGRALEDADLARRMAEQAGCTIADFTAARAARD